MPAHLHHDPPLPPPRMHPNSAPHDVTHLKVMRLLQVNPQMKQRELAQALGVSLGKTNFCLQALLAKGWLKVQNFAGKQNKLAYAYLLTPQGLKEKALLTNRFLQRKQQEYIALQAEIAALQLEAQAQAPLLEALGLLPASPENHQKNT